VFVGKRHTQWRRIATEAAHCSVVHELTPLLCRIDSVLSWTTAGAKIRRVLLQGVAGEESAMDHCPVGWRTKFVRHLQTFSCFDRKGLFTAHKLN